LRGKRRGERRKRGKEKERRCDDQIFQKPWRVVLKRDERITAIFQKKEIFSLS